MADFRGGTTEKAQLKIVIILRNAMFWLLRTSISVYYLQY